MHEGIDARATIRFYADEDYQGVLGLLQSIDRDVVPRLSDRVVLDQYLEKVVKHGTILVACLGGRIVGMSAFYCNDVQSKRGFWSLLAVGKEYRRSGLASRLLQETMQVARASGMAVMVLETSTENRGAVAFHEKHGFRESGRKREEGLTSDTLVMELRLR